MAGGRESRSVAALARSLSPLTLALALLSTMPGGVFSKGLALPPLNMTCDSVPYPFGARNVSLPGFEVLCGPNREAMLPIGEKRYKIHNVSLQESTVVIFAGPISQVCYDRNGKPTPDTGAGAMSLEGTPFTFSKGNKLVNIGCSRELKVSFTHPPGDSDFWPYITCTTSCNGSSDAITNGTCSGEACCEQDIPSQVTAAQSFTLSFNKTPSNVTGEEDGTCSAAFFLPHDDQVFTFRDAHEGVSLREALVPPGERRMILDWVIGNYTSCDQAQGYNFELPCPDDLGVCVESPRGKGCLCKCPEGYEGNPYLSRGCVGPPPPQLQGPSVCNHPENNPCTFIKYCNDVQGSASCSCPQGMIGDGRKMGSGCQKNFPLDTVLVYSLSPSAIPLPRRSRRRDDPWWRGRAPRARCRLAEMTEAGGVLDLFQPSSPCEFHEQARGLLELRFFYVSWGGSGAGFVGPRLNYTEVDGCVFNIWLNQEAFDEISEVGRDP